MKSVESILPKVEKRYLRYDFSAVEVHDMSLELAAKNQEFVNVENEKKAATSQYSSRLSSIKTSIGSLSDKVANGYEIREVTCDVVYHRPKQGMKTLTRKDTGAQIEEKMTDQDWNLWNQYDEKESKIEEVPAEDEEEKPF
ncbi:hypothetical protein [Chitinophaga japonensis]|nr:hypothetical protein [Chitinophaga japonensis]